MQEAREMAAAAKANNVVLVEAFTPRWNPQMQSARKMIADGVIGEVTSLEAGLTFFTQNPNDIRLSKPLAGGSLMEAGRSEEHTSDIQSLIPISYADFRL